VCAGKLLDPWTNAPLPPGIKGYRTLLVSDDADALDGPKLLKLSPKLLLRHVKAQPRHNDRLVRVALKGAEAQRWRQYRVTASESTRFIQRYPPQSLGPCWGRRSWPSRAPRVRPGGSGTQVVFTYTRGGQSPRMSAFFASRTYLLQLPFRETNLPTAPRSWWSSRASMPGSLPQQKLTSQFSFPSQPVLGQPALCSGKDVEMVVDPRCAAAGTLGHPRPRTPLRVVQGPYKAA
jgi:hypothetical protein